MLGLDSCKARYNDPTSDPRSYGPRTVEYRNRTGMERLGKIQLEPESDIVEVGADSDAESAVTDIGNDVDVEYEVGQSWWSGHRPLLLGNVR